LSYGEEETVNGNEDLVACLLLQKHVMKLRKYEEIQKNSNSK
jgi:hypothetical protein